MDFQLSDDQRAIADMAGSLFGDLCNDDRLRASTSSGETWMADLWAKCVETGLHALAIPEEEGGSGLGMTELMLVLEAQGRSLGLVPLWRHQIAAAALARFGGPSHQSLVEQAVAGERLLSVALDGLASTGGVSLEARPEGGGFALHGQVPAVPLGMESAAVLLPAHTPDGLRLVLLRLDAQSLDKVAGVLTHGEGIAELHCRGVLLSSADVLPAAALAWLEPRAIAALAALQLGVSAEQVRRTVAYVGERVQFERPIGSFQAVQMSLADAHMAIEALRSALWQLVYRLDAGLPAGPEALATRYLACETGHLVGHRAQHVHGGIGVDLTYPIHRYLYWSRALGLALGGSAATLERLGDWLANNDTLGWKYDLAEHPTL